MNNLKIINENSTKTTGLGYRGYLLAANRKTGAWHCTGRSPHIFYFSRAFATGDRSHSGNIGSWCPLRAALCRIGWRGGYLLLLLAPGNTVAAF